MFIHSLCLFFVFSALSSKALAQNVSQGRTQSENVSNASETKLNSRPPGWLLGLDLDATPGQIFEKSYANARIIIEQRREKERSDTNTESEKISSKIGRGAVVLNYRSLINSNNLFLHANATSTRDLTTSDVTKNFTEPPATQYSEWRNRDDIIPGAGLGLQLAPGFWAGIHADWRRRYYKSHVSNSPEKSDFTSKIDASQQTMGLEYRSSLAHLAFEYSVFNTERRTTRWSAPMRIGINDKLFAGFEFSGAEELDFASDYKAADSIFNSTVGIEQSGFTLSAQFEYQIIKYGSVEPVNSIKSKNGYITAALGATNGLRYLICAGYLTEVENGGASYSRRNEGGTILLQVARAQ
jgi:hypothetical protein